MRLIAISLSLAALASAATVAKPTYYKDVLPILQARCQECHRPGEIAPMAFTSYKETRPWAKGIREAVVTKKMPPWFANPNHGKFSNDRSLSADEIETLTRWADNGAPEGNPKEAPAPKMFMSGWNLPVKPDLVLQLPSAYEVPAKGSVDYQYVVVPTGFREDKWVEMVEARPTNRGLVHHAVIFIREPGNPWLRDEAKEGMFFVPPKTTADGKPRGDIDGVGSEMLTVYTPGNLPDVFKPGQARLIKAGSDLVFQMHYTANGKAGSDRTAVGLVFAKQVPTERITTLAVANSRLVIPPGDPNFRVPARAQIQNECTLLSFFPHMHLRGKAFEYKVQMPGEEAKTVLKVDDYKFNWQLSYRLAEPMKLPKGAVIEMAGYFDNSPNNPNNPDPKATVRWGEQSWEEMMVGFFDVAVPLDMDRRSFWRPRQKSE